MADAVPEATTSVGVLGRTTTRGTVDSTLDRTVGAVLRRRARQSPDEPLVKCGGDWLTAAELDARADLVAAGLAALGVGPGDRVAMLSENRQELIETIFGCARAGAVQVPLNYWLKGEFLRHQLVDSAPRVLVCDEHGAAAAGPFLREAGISEVIAAGSGRAAGGPDEALPVRTRTWESLLALGAPGRAPADEPGPDALAAIMYTSGTTGAPKGCTLAHSYFTAVAAAYGAAGWARPGDRVLSSMPLFHAGGQIVTLLTALLNDGSACIEPSFSARAFMRRSREEQATRIQGVAAMALALLAQPPDPDDRRHRLRLAIFGPLTPDQQQAFEQRFAVPLTGETYGQTECNAVSVSSVDGPRNRSSAGRPVPGVEVRIVDAAGEPVSVAAHGEIVVRPRGTRAPTFFRGYWNNPAATLAAQAELWHHTGDHGYVDADGFLHFVDRARDSLRRRGENVSSVELEQAIRGHEAVADVAVTAVPSPMGDDDIRASIVLRPGHRLDPAALFGWLAASLPYFAVPRYVDVRDDLPTNAVGRVQKQRLRAEGVPAGCWDFESMGRQIPRSQRRATPPEQHVSQHPETTSGPPTEPGYTLDYTVPASKLVPDLYPEFAEFAAMPRVFASGYLVGLIEQACMLLGDPIATTPDSFTVGARFDLTHETPSVVGSRLRVHVRLTTARGRRLEFAVRVDDGDEVVSRGTHTRYVVGRARFDAGLEARRARLRPAPGGVS
jgi:carnitine-CoA ligase